ncbi:peptidoglycan recognition protein 1-like [Saccostrea echinata]|uniref:peptidoglycan recognition protein 1-like n=1 Tax=Saccostrea echinata TaxID=191078 RepID=UPI002A8137F9|nr:peptidoglycan recognition protein 1-like [Saccostrea echinata]
MESVKEVHRKLLSKLLDFIKLNSWRLFIGQITEAPYPKGNVVEDFNILEAKGYLSPGKYDVLLKYFVDCDQRAIEYIEEAQKTIKELREPLKKVNSSEPLTSKIIGRNEWGATQPGGKVDDLQNLPKYVIISHSGSGINAFTEHQCAEEVRSYQTYHIYNRGWSDIGYNFLIGEDGNVYEGRGWGKEGAHTKGLNKYSIGICFIGNFDRRLPNQRALEAAKDLIRTGVKEGKIPTNFILKGHRDFSNTASPGECLYHDLQKWPFSHGN